MEKWQFVMRLTNVLVESVNKCENKITNLGQKQTIFAYEKFNQHFKKRNKFIYQQTLKK